MPTADAELVKILMRGLHNSEHRSAMMMNVPGNLQEFITEIERLEGYTAPPLKTVEINALLPLMGLSVAPTAISSLPVVSPSTATLDSSPGANASDGSPNGYFGGGIKT